MHLWKWFGLLVMIMSLAAAAGCSEASDNGRLNPTEGNANGSAAAIEPDIFLEDTDEGFRLQWDDSKYQGMYVKNIIRPEGDSGLVVHLVELLEFAVDPEAGMRALLYAVIVDADQRTLRSYPLIDAVYNDDDYFTFTSFAKSFGFLDGYTLVFGRPSNAGDSGGLQYDIGGLNILTGEQETLIAAAIPDIAPDFLAAGWMNAAGSKLYLASRNGGELWIADLDDRTVELTETTWLSDGSWVSLLPSPDGERIVSSDYHQYRFGIYTADGRLLNQLPEEQGFPAQPAIVWSPDSRYGVYQHTLDQSEGQYGVEEYLAPSDTQGIRMFDDEGRQLWSRTTASAAETERSHMEWVGWLSDSNHGVIHYYDRADPADRNSNRINSEYVMVEAAGGIAAVLQLADDLDELIRAEPVFGEGWAPVVLIDSTSQLVWLWETSPYSREVEFMHFISLPGSGMPPAWVSNSGGNDRRMIVYRYDPASRSLNQFEIEGEGGFVTMIGKSLALVSRQNYYHLRFEPVKDPL